MFRSKYSNFLTIILIVAIVFVVALISVLGVSAYKRYKNNKDAENAILDFENNIEDEPDIDKNTNISEGEDLIEQNPNTNTGNSSSDSTEGKRKVTYYNNFVMIGYIEIPTIGIKYPVLEKETVASLEQSVAVRYPDNAKLNQPGNVVIAGHNYRNGQFFSKLENVSTGDIIKITDVSGETLIYKVYEKYETTPEDVAYITRNVGENTEITLVTCTDDSNARIIVKARTEY